jgi:hypothetical protein
VIPHSYLEFMVASTSAAAALIGLLFVAISMRAELIYGPDAPPRTKGLASSSYTSLVNAFVLAIFALVPSSNLAYPAIVMAITCFYRTLRLHRYLQQVQHYLLFFSCAAYAYELVIGVILVVKPDEAFCFESICYIIFASFVIALTRAWKLITSEVPTSSAT